MGDIVRIGDQVRLTLQFGSDVGLSNNSARAVVADVLAQNGLSLTQYDNSQVGFFGGPATLTVLLHASDYGDKQDVAGHVAGIIYNQLGLSVSAPYAVSVIRGAGSQSLTIDAGPGSYEPMRTLPGSNSIPTIDGGVLIIDVPIPPEQVNPAPHTQDWLDTLARQLGMSRSTLEVAGVAILALVVVVGMRR
jgi:hypothetical protein